MVTRKVTGEAAVDAAVTGVDRRFGRLEVLFANGVIGDPEPTLMHDRLTENWRKVVDVNLNDVVYCARAALQIMVRQG